VAGVDNQPWHLPRQGAELFNISTTPISEAPLNYLSFLLFGQPTPMLGNGGLNPLYRIGDRTRCNRIGNSSTPESSPRQQGRSHLLQSTESKGPSSWHLDCVYRGGRKKNS
jgi:hypothetical protein